MTQKRLTKEEFKNEMKQKRLALFKKANTQLETVISNSDSFINYLNLQATIGYTITNTLLVMSENPKATFLKDYSRWKEDGAFPLKDQKGIPILEPSNEYTRRDGSKGINYNIKHVFDVSQTNYDGALPKDNYPSKEKLIKAMSYKTDVQLEYLDSTAHLTRSVYFDLHANCIYVQKGLSDYDTIYGLFREYVIVETNNPLTYLKNDRFAVCCIVYMLLYKYGIEPKDTSFSKECHNYFLIKDLKASKEVLKNMKKVFDVVSKRINHGLYADDYYQEMEARNK